MSVVIPRLDIRKRKPRNWVGNPCLYAGCRRVSTRANLCAAHAADFLTEVNDQIRGAGVVAHRVGVTLDGYVQVEITHGIWQSAHRIVMESMIGRGLIAGENVHHLNGNRADNRPENLELWVTSQPVGQRPADLVRYARMILERYENLGLATVTDGPD